MSITTRMNFRVGIGITALWLGAVWTAAAQAPDPALTGAQRWVGRALIVRGFYGENELRYDASGKVEGAPKAVDWTLAGVDLDAVKRVDAETIELDGLRVAIRYNPDNQLFERHPQKDQRVRILVGLRKVGSTANQLLGVEPVEETLGQIFSMGIDPALQRAMPDFWQHSFDPKLAWPGEVFDSQTLPSANATPPVSGLTPPVLRRSVIPETPEAEKDKVRGSVVLRVVVDTQGHMKRVAVLRPLGYGLDARAVEAAKAWTATPASLSGSPVAVRMDMAVDFAPVKSPGS